MRVMLIAFVAILLTGCDNPFQPASLIDLTCSKEPCRVRLLGVRAEPPDVPPNQSTVLTAFSVDAANQPVEIDWSRCDKRPPVGSTSAVDPACLDAPPQPYLASIGTGTAVTMTMPSVPLDVLGLPDTTGGFYVPVVLRLHVADRSANGVERVRINLGLPPNHNPAFAGIFFVPPSADGAATEPLLIDEMSPPRVKLGQDVTLRATFVPGSAESYLVFDGDPRMGALPRNTVEVLRVNWYSTAGELSEEVTDEELPDTVLRMKRYVPVSVPPEGSLVEVYAVGRDGRGGTVFAKRQLRLLPE
jgi:hypothetical protein